MFMTIRSSSGRVLGSALITGSTGRFEMLLIGMMWYRSPTFTIVAPLTRRIVCSSGMRSTSLTSP